MLRDEDVEGRLTVEGSKVRNLYLVASHESVWYIHKINCKTMK
jgi:hypothetical protein